MQHLTMLWTADGTKVGSFKSSSRSDILSGLLDHVCFIENVSGGNFSLTAVVNDIMDGRWRQAGSI